MRPSHPTQIRSRPSLSARGRFALDTGLFVAIIIASQPAWTGIGLHEWLAGLAILPALYHLAINWDWVVRIASGFIARLKATSRINLVVDTLLFIAAVTVMLSGVMVLPGVAPTSEGTVILSVWIGVHRTSSDLTLATMLLHFALHAKWMARMALATFLTAPGRHSVRRAGAAARDRGRR